MSLQELPLSDLQTLIDRYVKITHLPLNSRGTQYQHSCAARAKILEAELRRREELLFPSGIVMSTPRGANPISAEITLDRNTRTNKGWSFHLDGIPIDVKYQNLNLEGATEGDILSRINLLEVEKIRFIR